MGLVYGRDHQVALWAAQHLGIDNPFPCSAIGWERDGFLLGAALYNNFHYDHRKQPLSIEISLACVDFSVVSRQSIHAVMSYPFTQLRLRRLQATCAKRDKSVRRFVERLGFKLEGISRQGWRQGGDAAIYSMLHHECRWIKPNELRQPIAPPGS